MVSDLTIPLNDAWRSLPWRVERVSASLGALGTLKPVTGRRRYRYVVGQSKARFGQSAHDYVPAIAFDLFPAPYDWKNKQSFIDLYRMMMRIAKAKGIPLRSGLDWDMNGNFSDGWDAPHYELNPWREWAKKSKLFEG